MRSPSLQPPPLLTAPLRGERFLPGECGVGDLPEPAEISCDQGLPSSGCLALACPPSDCEGSLHGCVELAGLTVPVLLGL